MIRLPLRIPVLAVAAALSLSACTTDGYGYGGVSVGAGHYDRYGSNPHGGWYSDYYYPGTGYYVYDRGGKRHRWNNNQRAYWEQQRRERAAVNRHVRQDRRADQREVRQERRADGREVRQERRADRREARGNQRTEQRREARPERRETQPGWQQPNNRGSNATRPQPGRN